MRSKSEALHTARGKHVNLTTSLSGIIEGELLGDGTVSKTSPYAARYTAMSKYKLYLDWLHSEFAQYGLQGKPTKQVAIHSWGKAYTGYRFISYSYTELLPLWERWYPEGRKAVPRDFALTPRKLLHWWLGDGCYWDDKKRGVGARLHTNGFDPGSIDILREQLAQRGISTSTFDSHGPVIYVLRRSIPRLFEYMGPCPAEIQEIYGYKWPGTREEG